MKILARGFNAVILSIIHPDQTGFMPGKYTSINIRSAQMIAQLKRFLPQSFMLASLDTAKAFDSIEWPFLLAALCSFGFGTKFQTWVSILYRDPTSNLLVNGLLSPSIQQGYQAGVPYVSSAVCGGY